jgi:hypothetical protein
MSFNPVPPETPADRKRFDSDCELLPNGCIIKHSFEYGKGYAGFTIGYMNFRAHRVIYVWAHGEPNADLHHICFNRRCVNPEHIEVAAAGQPHHRGPSPNFCAHGHEFTENNTYITPRGERQCRACLKAASERYLDANRDSINAKRRANREHVVHEQRICVWCGAEFTPIRSTRKYCSKHCQSTANNRKQYQKRRGHGE